MTTASALAALLLGHSQAAAQASHDDLKWDVDFHVGAAAPGNQSSGIGTLPPLGTDVTPSFGPRRVVSTWYLGEGASELNQALRSVRLAAQVTPLDPLVTRRLSELERGAILGVRVSRAFTGRFSAEFAVEYGFGRQTFVAEAAPGFEATRASFVSAWNALLSGPLRSGQTVTSIATIASGRSRQLTTTGSVLIRVGRRGRLDPYVAVGAGLIANRGAMPSVTLDGGYEFTLAPPPEIPLPPRSRPSFHETDTVVVRTVAGNALGWVVGGGVKYGWSPRWGVRVDLRDLISASDVHTVIDAQPLQVEPPSGSAVLFIGTTPSLYFSTPSNNFSRSTLSGDPIRDFETFKGSGIEHRVDVTAGVFWRF